VSDQQPPYGQPGQPNPYQPAGGYNAYGGGPAPFYAPDHPQSSTVLILGILSLAVCQVLGPFAWVMGNRVVGEIDASGGRMGGRSQANIGRVLGDRRQRAPDPGRAVLPRLRRHHHRRDRQQRLTVTDHGVPPARPHHRLTEDGRRVREVLTYARRGSRFTPQQAAAWEAHHEAWVVPDEAVDREGFSFDTWFGRGPDDRDGLVVEIGSGVGEATAVLAATRPTYDVLAFEVWRPGVASTLARLAEAGVTNVRLCSVDAVWSLEHLLAPASVAELWTFFPDPWHKTRHHKRRLVNPEFAALAASRLRPGGVWRLATDWADYAEVMVEVLDAEPTLTGGTVDRWEERPVTKFERKGVAAGRAITDLTYRRISSSSST
jgi:tRNA (guanine-N7-)-methyltransferase